MKPSPILVALASLLLLCSACAPTPVDTPTASAPAAEATAAVAESQPTSPPTNEATQPAQEAPAADVAATVNGKPIPLNSYEIQLQIAMASYASQPGIDTESEEGKAALSALRRQVLDWLIDQAIIDQAAERLGINISDADIEAEVQRVREQNPEGFADWLEANGFTEDSFRAQIRLDLAGAHVRDLVTQDVPAQAEQVHLRQILVQTEGEARDLLDKLRAGAGSFESLAQQFSLDEMTAENGGDMGWVPQGVLAESVEQAAFALQPGQISDPVQSLFGWHLLKVEERDPNRDLSPEMLGNLRQQKFMEWLEAERAKAQIKRFVEDS